MSTLFRNIKETVAQTDKRYGATLFYIALTLMLTSVYWMGFDPSHSNLIGVLEKVHIAVMSICILRFIMIAIIRPWVGVLGLVVLGVAYMSYANSHSGMLMKSALLIVIAGNTNFETTLRVYRNMLLVLLVVIPVLYLIGYSCDIKTHSGMLTGHSWGFGNPNRLGEVLFILTFASFVDLRQPPRISRVVLCCLIGSFVTYFTTLCLSSALLMILFPVIYWGLSRYQPCALVVVVLPWLALAVSLVLMFVLGGEEESSTFLSRFIMPYDVYKQYGISFWGQYCLVDMMVAPDQYKTVWCIIDNGYLSLLITYGVVPLVVMMTFLSFTLYRVQRSQQRVLLAFAICALLYTFMENFIFDVMISCLLLFPFSINGEDSKKMAA